MAEGNGYYKEQLSKIQSDVTEIKDDLSHSIDRLTDAVHALTSKFDAWMRVAKQSIPIKAVFWMFLIMVLGLTGIEGVKYLATLHP